MKAIQRQKQSVNTIHSEYGCTNSIQEVTLEPGDYLLECWGGSGGSCGLYTSKCAGGYSKCVLEVYTQTTIYIAAGGCGGDAVQYNLTVAGGYNGGGGARSSTSNLHSSGGGATHIAIKNNRGVLSNYYHNQDEILLVAGGGGGGWYTSLSYGGTETKMIGGAGGGLIGCDGYGVISGKQGCGGTQTAGGTNSQGISYTSGCLNAGFGVGGSTAGGTVFCAGGGGGWYGGGYGNSGGGGSGYIKLGLDGGTYTTGDAGFVSNPDTAGHGHVRITTLYEWVDLYEIGPDENNSLNLYYSDNNSCEIELEPGNYIISCNGANGGGAHGGRGGNSIVNLNLTKTTILFGMIGGAGGSGSGGSATGPHGTGAYRAYGGSGGYNGGGNGGDAIDLKVSCGSGSGGGGATHIAMTNRGELKNYELYKDEILVVAGGGGGGLGGGVGTTNKPLSFCGGDGGGLIGEDGSSGYGGRGGSQTRWGSGNTYNTGFGYGDSGASASNQSQLAYAGAGGGGGWYGGGGGYNGSDSTGVQCAGGGSSYIKHNFAGVTVTGGAGSSFIKIIKKEDTQTPSKRWWRKEYSAKKGILNDFVVEVSSALKTHYNTSNVDINPQYFDEIINAHSHSSSLSSVAGNKTNRLSKYLWELGRSIKNTGLSYAETSNNNGLYIYPADFAGIIEQEDGD